MSDLPSWTDPFEGMEGVDPTARATNVTPLRPLPEPIDWPEFFATEFTVQWLVEDLWPTGRQMQLFAARKTGKSLVMLWMAANMALGRDPFRAGWKRPPVRVGYLDYEMTDEDLRERLTDMRFEAPHLTNLMYWQLPDLPPLNTAEGAHQLLALVDRYQLEVVVIDTLSRVIAGEENSSQGIIDFYRHTGIKLKQRGVALARLDHEGHEKGRARGSSAKADDVDLNWQLEANDDGYTFRNVGSRVGYVDDEVHLAMHRDPLYFVRVGESWPQGTRDAVTALRAAGAASDISVQAARNLLLEKGFDPPSMKLLSKALTRIQREIEYNGLT